MDMLAQMTQRNLIYCRLLARPAQYEKIDNAISSKPSTEQGPVQQKVESEGV
jgi:hypothetical protein